MTTTPCPGPDPCGHTAAEHNAFDRGVRDGRAGVATYDNPYLNSFSYRQSLVEAWATGYSVGALDYREELGEEE